MSLRTRTTIGKCVIVMNNYWNEYRTMYVDKSTDNVIQKFIQFSKKNSLKINKEKVINDLNLNSIQNTDVFLKSFNINSLSVDIGKIVEALKVSLSNTSHILAIPILISYQNKFLERGVYTFDLNNEKLLKIGDEKLSNSSESKIYSIHWFLDIESSIALNDKSALLEGYKNVIEIITKFILHLEQNNNFKTHKYSIPLYNQSFTKSIGLNPRKCILIENIELK